MASRKWWRWGRRSESVGILTEPVQFVQLSASSAEITTSPVCREAVALGWQELLGLPKHFVQKHPHCKHLDLAHNFIGDARWLPSLYVLGVIGRVGTRLVQVESQVFYAQE